MKVRISIVQVCQGAISGAVVIPAALIERLRTHHRARLYDAPHALSRISCTIVLTIMILICVRVCVRITKRGHTPFDGPLCVYAPVAVCCSEIFRNLGINRDREQVFDRNHEGSCKRLHED
jgi:hypothetical protein